MQWLELWRESRTARKAPSLTVRIVAAMLCMASIVAVTYGVAIYYGITLAEETLIGREMQTKLERASKSRGSVFFDEVERIYSDERTSGYPPVPERYRSMEDGFGESLEDDTDYFVYKLTRNGQVWVIVQDQYGFENEEQELYIQAAIGFLIVILLAVVVGLWLAGAVTRPVHRLADDVKAMATSTTFRPLSHRPTEDEIGELALTVETTLAKFNEALARERAFTADVSHELRTPLMVISSTAELLRLPATDAVREERLRRIESACRRLNRLIRVFLELARGRDETAMEIVPWATVAENAVADWQREAEKKGLVLAWQDQSTTIPQVKSAFAESVIDNLLRNALQYTERGQVTVVLTDYSLSVADTGRGIADEEKTRVLQAFVRGDTAPGEGYGWGLSLVRRICRKEGWVLSFADNPPQGTIFTVTFRGKTTTLA